LILPGNDERHQVNFEGNLKLNDRLFSKVNEEDVASQLFQANDIEENNWLKWVIQEKANPNQLNNCNKLWNKNKTFNGGIEEKANPKKLLSDSELKEQKKKNIDEKFAALFKDQNRSRTHLPTSTENNKGIFAKDENNVITLKDGEGFLTQENYSDFIQHCFSNIVEYNNLLEDEKEFYEKFKALGIHNKKHFVFNIYSNTTEQDAIDKLEDQFTLADRGLLSEDEQVRLNSLQAEFLLLAPEKQERLKDTFFGVDAESLLFYGMDKQYQDKIKSLSMQEQALYLLFVDQHYKTPIAASKVLFTGMGMLAVDDKDTESFYSFKPLPVNPYFPRVVNIEVKYNVRFSPFGDYSPVRDICASDEATGIYTVLFDEDETLLGAKISLDDVKSNLKVHGKDGTLLQQGLRKISAAEIELMQEDNVVII
ncbi:MAG: hypothetical protein K0R08_1899, partial [Solimicrobium sp.]|nr:hypothetical protein [Solimicrobium sp.]